MTMLGMNGDGSKGINWDFNELGYLVWDELPMFHWLCRDRDGSWQRPSPSRRAERRKDGIRWRQMGISSWNVLSGFGIAQKGLEAHSWKCPGMRDEGDGNFFTEWVVSTGIAQRGLDAHLWRCPGIRYEGDGNFSWNGLLRIGTAQKGLEFPPLEVSKEYLDVALLGWVTGWAQRSQRSFPPQSFLGILWD